MTRLQFPLTLRLVLSLLAGFSTPWVFTWLLGYLGGAETYLAEQTVRHFPSARPAVHPFLFGVVPCIDALVCAVAYGIPLSFLSGRRFVLGWLVFMFGAVVSHFVVAVLLTPAPIGGFDWAVSTLLYLPFYWLFSLVLLGFLFVVALRSSRVGNAA